VRDWTALVSDRLTRLDLDPHREDHIRAEIAAHLDDYYHEARRRGDTDDEAAVRTLALVTDWQVLARTLQRAERGDGLMTVDAKTMLVPGLTAMTGAALAVFGAIPMLPASLWVAPAASMHVLVSALLVAPYVACGGLGAWWSRRSGGTRSRRLVAGFFPLLLNLTIVVAAIALSNVTERQAHPGLGMNIQPAVLIAFLVVPGMALMMGILPFLKEPSPCAVEAPAITQER
jgi:hypothetical protein